MAKDTRLYAKLTLDFADHAKIFPLSDAAFRCLVEATLYSRKHLTDGLLARRYAVARWSLDVLRELCQNDDEKPSLIECEDGWLIHDYAEIQDTKAEVEARRERNSKAGQLGGLAKSKRTAKQVASKSLSESLAETETETETNNHLVDLGGGVTLSNAREPHRPSCSKHPNGNPSDDPCHGCRRARKWDDDHAAEIADSAAEVKRRLRDIADNCPDCLGTNLVEVGDNAAAKCLHPYAAVS